MSSIGICSGVCRDPEDNKFVSCAISAGVTYVVTGDKDLSDLGHYQTVKIIKVHDFLEILR